MSVGGAEHLALPAAYPRLREVNVYLGWFGPFARPMQAGALVGSVATRLPGVREALTFAGERLAALAEGPEPARRPAASPGSPRRRSTRAGHQLAEVHLSGGNWYAFTADFIAWAARAAAGGRVKGAGRARAGRGVRARGARARLRARRAQPRSRLSQRAEPHQPRGHRPAGSTPPSSVTRSGDFAGRRRRQRSAVERLARARTRPARAAARSRSAAPASRSRRGSR